MKRKPKMRLVRTCKNCQHLLGKGKKDVEYFCEGYGRVGCMDRAKRCNYFRHRNEPHPDFGFIEEFDPDAKENWYCCNCKWYNGHEDRGGVCMLNPPEIFPHYNTQGKYVETRYERAEVNWDDYCSRWEKAQTQV